MKTSTKILYLYGTLFLAWVIFGSNASNPPDGRTGAPFDSSCTGCHSPSGSFNGEVSISGIPATVEAGTTYPVTLTITATSGSPVRGGFQLVSVFLNNNMNAGSLSSATGMGTNTLGGRTYIEHRGARNFSGGSVSWTFNWTAPAGPDGASIRMYYIGNMTNGNGSSNGDRPVTGNSTFTLNAASAPVVATITNQTNVSCNGGTNGSATASGSGGTGPYTFAWSNGANGATVNNLAAGSYTVTVTDNVAASGTANVTITQPSVLNVTTSGTNVLCNGGNSGSASATGTGGTSPYTYAWSNGLNSRNIGNLTAGMYTVTVTDANGCTRTGSLTLTQPSAMSLAVTATAETSAMAGDGTATATASGGTTPYTYSWSNGSTAMKIEDLDPGTYMVTVTDANGCNRSGMAVVQGINCALMSTVQKTDVSCFGDNSGSVSISVSGAQNPVTYQWSNGKSGSVQTDMPAGMYDVTIEDNNGCQSIVPVVISQPDQIQPMFSTNLASCADSPDAQVLVSLSGGMMPYTYVWSNGIMTNILDTVTPGTYSLTVTDANNCEVTSQVEPGFLDTTPPLLITQSGLNLYLDSVGAVHVPLQLPFVGAVDKCGVDSLWLSGSSPDCEQAGIVSLTFFARDVNGNLTSESSTVNILDTIFPVFLSCVTDIEADSGEIINYELPVAMDNCGLDTFYLTEGLESGNVFPVGETKVSYMAVDPSGNLTCCSFLVTVKGTITSTMDSDFARSINLYPNPVRSQLHIERTESDGLNSEITILDGWGRALKSWQNLNTSHTLALDVSFLPEGIYFLRINDGKRLAILKWIKEGL